ncbi:MAG: CBS domain-containing protein, partial [Candidatus Omnitrophica bacterium]|nr:CBS domain-containing protein [Candidatus Omnitrophota bacterium]
MDLIATHTSADFDALSSLVAARKLYPRSRLLLPGSQELNVRQFLSLSKDILEFETERNVRLDDISRLILVDTRHENRIGKARELLEDPGIKVVIYDHHPRTKYDIRADKDTYRRVGATVTMLIDKIRTKRLRITPLEATLMALGIYEETGSLTYRTTTRRDIDAVSFLMSKGANLNIVSSFLNRGLSAKELIALSKLITETKVIETNGISIGISMMDADEYIGELGMLIQKLLDVENFKVMFVFVKMDKKITLIARSRTPFVDVNKILKFFGGGGHTTAASATIREGELSTLIKDLRCVINRTVRARVNAEDCMETRVHFISPDTKINEAGKILRRSPSSALLVRKNKKIIGILSGECIKKAVINNFGHSKVKGYMSTKIYAVRPSTPMHELKKIMYDKKIGHIPVFKKGKIAGLVTRSGILKSLFAQEEMAPGKVGLRHRHQTPDNLLNRMREKLPSQIMNFLRLLADMARERGCRIYVVGGFVRDLILGVRNLDVDLVVEGDAAEFARYVSDRLAITCVVHKKFGTATLFMKETIDGVNVKVDIASARTETYGSPGALPSVTFCSIKEDLYRRDFTINAMAIDLDKKNYGRLVDYYGGRGDLRCGKIKVLHDESFIDDPTRIFRAVRFEQRYNFKIDRRTVSLIKNAVKKEMFDAVSGERLREEIVLLLEEKEPLKAIKRMRSLHELRFIHPKIEFKKRQEYTCRRIDALCGKYKYYLERKRSLDRWLIYFMSLVDSLSLTETLEVADRFVFRRSDRLRVVSCKKGEKKILRLLTCRGGVRASVLYKNLEPLSYEALLFLASKCSSRLQEERLKDFIERHNGTRLRIRGEDLKRMGIEPGP